MNLNIKKKFVAHGVFFAELNELLQKTFGLEGYAGLEIPVPDRPYCKGGTMKDVKILLANSNTVEDILIGNGSIRKLREIKSLI